MYFLFWCVCLYFCIIQGISRDSAHKRRATGGKRKSLRKKRKFELGRPAANTKVSAVPAPACSLPPLLYLYLQ